MACVPPFGDAPQASSESPAATAKKTSVFERACERFGAFQPKGFSLPLQCVPQLKWQEEAAAAAFLNGRQQQLGTPPFDAATDTAAAIGQGGVGRAEPAPIVGTSCAEDAALQRAVHPLDRAAMRKQGLLVPQGEVTALSEEFRILRRAVLPAGPLEYHTEVLPSAQVIMVSSPHPGEGKTFTAINLALSIAEEAHSGTGHREVVLVDADCIKPSIAPALGLPHGPGLLEMLADSSLTSAETLIPTDCAGLSILTAGAAAGGSETAVTGQAIARVLAQLRQAKPRSLIIVDTPPALIASTAAEISPYAGQCLLVARAGVTGQSALEDSAALLSACPSIKLLLNGAFFSPSGRKFGSYYGEGLGLGGRRG